MTQSFNRGHLALLSTAALFGLAFIFQRHAAQHVAPLWFMSWRFSLGTIALGIFWWWLHRRNPRGDYGRWVFYGTVSGLLMFAGMMAQQWGLAHTTAGKSGFLTGLYVVLVPIIGLLFGLRAGKATALAVLLAAVGLYFFADIRSASSALNWNIGDSVTLLGTLCWALQVLWTAVAVRHSDVLAFSLMQLLVVAILSILGSIAQEGVIVLFSSELLGITFWDIVFTGIGSSAIAFFLQAVGQRRVLATHAAIILSLEAVFALLFGWFFLHEAVTMMMLFGCAFMFAAMLSAQFDDLGSHS
ncbi:DMT family transporter [Suttonella sp. R2A3]|uniref:DMT family transporter n=1 Tax=Suttonella sp. R2A3 TaxID=2908648 RepID=UPI001F389EFA|nr:DMT family transporter [Suttonella sp. R2A3]UJF24674.1 DMT family transporter [Suttonella sp. R2A3]